MHILFCSTENLWTYFQCTAYGHVVGRKFSMSVAMWLWYLCMPDMKLVENKTCTLLCPDPLIFHVVWPCEIHCMYVRVGVYIFFSISTSYE